MHICIYSFKSEYVATLSFLKKKKSPSYFFSVHIEYARNYFESSLQVP